MKKTGKKQDKTVDYSGLTAAELLAVLAQKEGLLADACEQRDSALSERDSAVNERDTALAQRNNAIVERNDAIAQRDKYKALTDELLRLAKIQRFGASSEKHPHQINLFDEAELEAAIDDLREQVPEETHTPAHTTTNKKKTRNRGFSATLNRIRREWLLSDEEKAGASKTFFSKVKEELEYIPAQLNVVEIWQEKAVFDTQQDEHMVAAARPTHPLGKCIATTSLLAYIITSKYADGLPLYRLNNMLARLGHEIGRNTMANWVIRLDEVFHPLIKLAREQQNQGNYIQADETRIQVLDEAGKSRQSDKWMWVTRINRQCCLTMTLHAPVRFLHVYSMDLTVSCKWTAMRVTPKSVASVNYPVLAVWTMRDVNLLKPVERARLAIKTAKKAHPLKPMSRLVISKSCTPLKGKLLT